MQLTKINGKYELLLPEHRAAREQWDIDKGGWEVARTEEMLKVLKPTDILFEGGVEEGDLTALFVKYSGCQVVMFEPNDRVWPCIKAIWEANDLPVPISFFPGFLSSKTAINHVWGNWWQTMTKDGMIHDHGFKQLYENYPDVPQITLDDYCAITGIYPTVLNLDVEGAEWDVIKGAEQTLRTKKPIIFMSVHAEFLFDSYRNEGIWKEKYGDRCFVVHMLRFIDELGYKHEIIEWDYHECHAKFTPI